MNIKKITVASLSLVMIAGVAGPATAETNVDMNTEVRSQDLLNEGRIKVDVRDSRDQKVEVRGEVKDMRASTTQVIKDLRKDAREDIKNIREDIKDQIHDARGEFRKDVANVRVKGVSQLLTATIGRLQKIIDRIESRLAKIQTEGGITVEAQASVNLAKASLVDAQAQVTAINAIDLSGTMSTTTAQTNFNLIKADAAKARTDLESARGNLLKAVRSIMSVEKGLKGKLGATTTTTVSQ